MSTILIGHECLDISDWTSHYRLKNINRTSNLVTILAKIIVMESGHIKVDQMRKKYYFRIKGAKIFAACNEISRLSRPL